MRTETTETLKLVFSGDLFIIVYSIDSRESFEEAQRLQLQIFDCKTRSSNPGGGGGSSYSGSIGLAGGSSSSSWRKRKPYIPMVVVGNKCEMRTGAYAVTSAQREVETWELMKLAEHRTCVGCLEASAKRNVNIEEIFLKLFLLAKLPTEMTPSLHRKVTPSFVVTSSPRGSRRRMTLRRRLSDAYGAVAVDARRPSIRTDLMIVKAKQQMEESEEHARKKSRKKCTIQ